MGFWFKANKSLDLELMDKDKKEVKKEKEVIETSKEFAVIFTGGNNIKFLSEMSLG